MALVRCPIHDIPYNDANPRGCPACWREKQGTDDTAQAIRELARVSRQIRQSGTVDAPAPPKEPTAPAPPAAPVTTPPRRPTVTESRLARLARTASERRVVTLGITIGLALAIWLWAASGPKFVEGWNPPRTVEEVLPLAIEPAQPIEVVFSILGPRAPQAHPHRPNLARYSYGTDLLVDALNGMVSQITIRVGNRSWRGLRVGLSEREARGTLALLGSPQEISASRSADPQVVQGYAVYESMERRPRRTFRAEVRPPNGCFDALVDLQPRAIGVLLTDSYRYAVIGQQDAPLEWVVTEVRIVSRSMPAPDGEAAVC
ncbi:MAG: hypothetical protein ACE5PT_02945 [Gemmatimonadales bacterium]